MSYLMLIQGWEITSLILRVWTTIQPGCWKWGLVLSLSSCHIPQKTNTSFINPLVIPLVCTVYKLNPDLFYLTPPHIYGQWRNHYPNMQDKIITILTGSAAQLASSWQTKIKWAVTQYRPCYVNEWASIYACQHSHSWAGNQSLPREWTQPPAHHGTPWCAYNLPFLMLKSDSSQYVIQHMWTTFKCKYDIQQNFNSHLATTHIYTHI